MIETIFLKYNKNVDCFQKIERVAKGLAAALR
jgi:hypothetical protein